MRRGPWCFITDLFATFPRILDRDTTAVNDASRRRRRLALLLAAAFPLYGIARSLSDARAAALATLLFLSPPLIANFGRWRRAEVPVLLAVVAAVWALLRAVRARPAAWGFVVRVTRGLGRLSKRWPVLPGRSALLCGLVAHRLAAGPIAGAISAEGARRARDARLQLAGKIFSGLRIPFGSSARLTRRMISISSGVKAIGMYSRCT